MKILHTVEKYHPSNGGMYEVVRQLSEHLAKYGHNVTVATTKLPDGYHPDFKGVEIKEFDIAGNFTSGMSGEIEKYQDFLINSDFDVITNFAAQQIMTDAMLPVLDKISTKKVFVPTGFAAFRVNEYQEYYKKMGDWFKKFDANVFLSNDYQDINYARKSDAKNIIVIPNGADENEFLKDTNIDIRKKLSIPKNDFLILLVGSHTGKKGHKEAIEIFSSANIKNATLVIVGSGKEKCYKKCNNSEKLNILSSFVVSNKKIINKHLSREKTVEAFKEADLFLFPSNIECSPVVLFEAMASKTPFLVTDVGNAKEIIDWSGGGILLPTEKNARFKKPLLYKIKLSLRNMLVFFKVYDKKIERNRKGLSKAKIKESVKVLENLYNNKKQLNRLTKNGYDSWLKKFTWGKISKDYDNLYKKILTK